jgi:hypothetical protein
MLASWKKALKPRRTRAITLLVAGAILAVATASTAMARHATRAHHKTLSPGRAAKLSAQSGGPRVSSIDLQGDSVVVTGVATGPGGEATRTFWYETVQGAAYAEKMGAKTLTRKVLDASGKVLSNETDPIQAGNPPAYAPLTLSGAGIARGAQQRASGLGATVVATHYVSLFGGTAELVVQPTDPASFVQSAGSKVASILGALGHENRAYLITIVDATRAPLLVLGYTPGVGGGAGQGVGWQAPGVRSDAIVGEPVTVGAPENTVPEWRLHPPG